MSRSWQYIGFNEAAQAILAETKKVGTMVITIIPLEGKPNVRTEDVLEPAYTKEVYERQEPWIESTNELYRYTFSDGRVLEGYVQAEPWSSGPCTFMALRDAATGEPIAETLWPQSDIDNA